MPLPPPVTREDREERRRRVERLRRQVARGEYRVPASAVADAILEHLSSARPRPE
jgi:anti-sigma28 factor (negative regulator of flagellin synthesis)